ncbi:MAG: guanylate kinase, partial [Gemmatimonadetes bacterium]|nr:guanylate kinase [Gemmatimonadota bacterium]
MSTVPRSAFPVVLAGPSGAGKTTLAQRLVQSSGDFRFSVSATTREPRRGERDGWDYHFRDRAGFEAMAASGELAEWAEVHGQLYGTPKAEREAAARDGRHVVLDIDVQGARQIRGPGPVALLVLVLPPWVEALGGRLAGRGTEAAEQVARRLRTALGELQAVPEFDHAVVNEDLGTCVELI